MNFISFSKYFVVPLIRTQFKNSLTFHNRWNRFSYIYTSSSLNVIQHIKMPSLSPTMTEGKIIKWLKKEGDPIKPGDLLCEIQTDKAIMAFETEEEGTLAKILVKEGSDVKVGSQIAVMVEEGEDWKDVEVPPETNLKAEGKVEVEEAYSTVVTSETFQGIEVKMPSLSPTMVEGTIVKWLKKEGDKLSPGDALCEIQTDKAVMVFDTEEEGILAKILVSENMSGVKVGMLIALIVSEDQDWRTISIPKAVSVEPLMPLKSAISESKAVKCDEKKFWPAVKFLLDQYQLKPHWINPSGPKGRLLKKDVLKYISENKLSPKVPPAVPLPTVLRKEEEADGFILTEPHYDYVDKEISNMRKIIAKRLSYSKSEIPHGYSVIRARVDQLIESRYELKFAGINVSLNDFVLKAVALALVECPYANCVFINDQVQISPTVDIAVAVATSNGLITPIIKSANNKTVLQISHEVKNLALKARKGSLQPHEFQGGSFTISNLGMFGIKEFSAIINPPQCGILAIGSGEECYMRNGTTMTLMTCTLSYDERAIDQLEAAKFMNSVQYYLQSPTLLLVSSNRILKQEIEKKYASST